MMFPVISNRVTEHKGKKGKITCVTCKLQGCLGRCRFETVDSPRPPKAVRNS